MRILHCVLTSLLAILLNNSSNPLTNYNNFSSVPTPKNVKYFTLAVQWPQGLCTGANPKAAACQINPVPTEFTIHGLWPKPNGAESAEAFDPNEIANLTSELNENWPDLLGNSNEGFWLHEWDEHGKYSAGLGLWEYFNKTLELFKDVGQGQLVNELDKKQITPSNTTEYQLVDIEDAVKNINGGFSGAIRCVQRKASSKQQQIQEIRFRYAKDFQKQNNPSTSNCGTKILFPAPPPPNDEL